LPSYQLSVADNVYKQLKKLTPVERKRVVPAILALEENPFPAGKKWKRLKTANARLIRLRVGDYRVLYEVEGGFVYILAVVHRRDLERWLGQR